MNVLVIGAGSIGRRYISLLTGMGMNVVVLRHSKNSPKIPGVTNIYETSDLHQIEYNHVIITSPSIFHLDSLKMVCRHGLNVLVEKPLCLNSTQLDQFNELITTYQLNVTVGYCLRYHPVIQHIRNVLGHEKPYLAVASSLSNLPLWRKDKDYRNIYSYSQERSGGIMFDLSHELDTLQFLYGKIQFDSVRSDKLGMLPGDSDDTAYLRGKSGGVNFVVNLNYSSHLRRREMIVLFEEKTFLCDLDNNCIIEYCNEQEVNRFRFDKVDYVNEQLKDFLNGAHGTICTFETKKYVECNV